MAAGEVPVIAVSDWNDIFDTAAREQLSAALPEYLVTRRWFRAKARPIQRIAIEDVMRLPLAGSVLFTRVDYADGGRDYYLLATRVESDASSEDIIATIRAVNREEKVLANALASPELRNLLLNAVLCGYEFSGEEGVLRTSRTSALPEQSASPLQLPSSVSKAEQSNSSIIYGDKFIFKIFRKLEAGINPDIEVGRFLTERRFQHTPAVLGFLQYRATSGQIYEAGILQTFVKNQGDAWKYTLDALSAFFHVACDDPGPHLRAIAQHPLDAATGQLQPLVDRYIGAYLDSAELIGKRTAQMHAALAGDAANPDFAPEPFTSSDAEALYRDMLNQADIAFGLLRRKQAALEGEALEDARAVLKIEHRVMDRFAELRQLSITAARIRIHGDYHLGQVLFTGKDFMIIDFEGEPARPLPERRLKALALRDVAGMVRSFQYAAYAALFGQVHGVMPGPATESWAAIWNAGVSATFLRAYFKEAGSLPFAPSDERERRVLLDVFLLQKALYEVAYELNNRPEWVRIPLRGILSLVA